MVVPRPRTQGAPVIPLPGRLRTRPRGEQRGPVAQTMFRRVLLHSTSGARSLRADDLVVRAAPARPDRRRSAPLLEAGPNARAQGHTGRRVALLPVFPWRRPFGDSPCLAYRHARRTGVV